MHYIAFALGMVLFVSCGIRSAFERVWLIRLKWVIVGASAFTFFAILSGAIYWST